MKTKLSFKNENLQNKHCEGRKKVSNTFKLLFFIFLLQAGYWQLNGQNVQFSSGSGTYTVPAGVSALQVKVWGAGGGGGGSNTNNQGGSGGGSGAYTIKTFAVSEGQQFTYAVGAGGTEGPIAGGPGGNAGPGGNGGASTFVGPTPLTATNMIAGGGTGGLGNAGTVGSGGVTSGGDIGSLNGISGTLGGLSGGNGGNAPGNGGTGGLGNIDGAGFPGNAPGGGGGGGERNIGNTSFAGGAGGAGKIEIFYTFLPSITSFSPTTFCTTGGQEVTITGTFLTGVTAVAFNGIAAASFVIVNDTTITAITPSNITAGVITITTANSSVSSGAYTVQVQPNAGTNGTLTVCVGTTPSETELFAALGGTPDADGDWSNVGLVYTYTVAATAPCTTAATATVTVTEQAQPNAGTNGTLTVCQGTTPSNEQLLAALGGTPATGGTWTNDGLVYTYTVAATAPCTTAATAIVTVTEQAQPNAGTNGTLTVCQGTTPSNEQLLAALGGTPATGGTWSNVGLVYTYTQAGTAPCGDNTATVTVTEQAATASAGTNGALTVCAGTTPTDAALFAALGGTPATGGTWTNAGLVYTYTQAGTSPCGDNTATVTVTEQAQPNAGEDGTLTIANGEPTESELFAALGGTPTTGGTWTNTGLVYTYTVSAPPCAPATATVTVTLSAGSFNVSKLAYYPVPVIDVLTIFYESSISSIEVYTVTGQRIRSVAPNQSSTTVDFSDLPAAVYLVKVTSNGNSKDFKVIKK